MKQVCFLYEFLCYDRERRLFTLISHLSSFVVAISLEGTELIPVVALFADMLIVKCMYCGQTNQRAV
jgi:hypothetical protein